MGQLILQSEPWWDYQRTREHSHKNQSDARDATRVGLWSERTLIRPSPTNREQRAGRLLITTDLACHPLPDHLALLVKSALNWISCPRQCRGSEGRIFWAPGPTIREASCCSTRQRGGRYPAVRSFSTGRLSRPRRCADVDISDSGRSEACVFKSPRRGS